MGKDSLGLSWIPPNEVFHGKTFTVPYVYNTTYMTPLNNNNSLENFRGALETAKNMKV